jgi:hypothetical protein
MVNGLLLLSLILTFSSISGFMERYFSTRPARRLTQAHRSQRNVSLVLSKLRRTEPQHVTVLLDGALQRFIKTLLAPGLNFH